MVADTGTVELPRRVSEVYGRAAWNEFDLESAWSGNQVDTRDVDSSRCAAALLERERIAGTDACMYVSLGQALCLLANKYFEPNDREQHVVTYTALLAAETRSTEYFAPSIPLRPSAGSVDWDRWHDLLDIKAKRQLTNSEEREYQVFTEIVARLDAEEEEAADAALDHLASEHERVLDSIRRLTAAVRAAAERT